MCSLEQSASKAKKEYTAMGSDNELSPEELFTKRKKLKEWRDIYKVEEYIAISFSFIHLSKISFVTFFYF